MKVKVVSVNMKSGTMNVVFVVTSLDLWKIATNITFIIQIFMFTLITFTLTFNEG